MYLSVSICLRVGSFPFFCFFCTFDYWSWFFNLVLFIPTEGDKAASGMSGSTFCHKDIIAFGERTSVAFPKSCVRVNEGRKRKKRNEKTRIPVLLIPYLSFLKSVLIFHRRDGVLGVLTVQKRICRIIRWTPAYFFEYRCSYCAKRKDLNLCLKVWGDQNKTKQHYGLVRGLYF